MLVRAVDPTTLPPTADSHTRVAAINEASEYLAGAAVRLRKEGIRPVVRSVWLADPAHATSEVARTVKADLLVMASRHRNDARRLIPGPIAELVRDRTRLPIVLVAAGHRADDAPSRGATAAEVELVHA